MTDVELRAELDRLIAALRRIQSAAGPEARAIAKEALGA